MPRLDINDHLVVVGNLGRHQVMTLTIGCMMSTVMVMQILLPILNHMPLFHKCDDDDQFVNTSAVSNNSSPFTGACTFQRQTDNGSFSMVKCQKFSYAVMGDMSTIVSEFDLVCEKMYLTTLANVLWMVCEGIGAIVGSAISDRFGRKYLVVTALITVGVLGPITASSVHIAMYIVLRCLTALTSYGGFVGIISLITESVAPNRRTQALNTHAIFWVFGGCNLAWIGYLLPNWRHLQLTVSILSLPVGLASIWMLNESPHFLFANGRIKEAYQELQKMARMNRVDAPELDKDIKMLEEGEKAFEADSPAADDAPVEPCTKICQYPRVLIRLLIYCYGWIACGFCYYALTFGVSQLPGNLYINVFMGSAVEGVAILGCFVIALTGRKKAIVTCNFVASLALFICIFMLVYFPGSISVTVLSFVGKLFVTASWQIMGIWQMEIFPTTQRCLLIGITAVVGRIAIVVAPFAVDSHKFSQLPNAIAIVPSIFFILMLFAGLLNLIPPETNKRKIPETYEESNKTSFPFAEEATERADSAEDTGSLAETKINA